MSESDIIDGLVCPSCRADVVIQPVRDTSHTLIWHCGRLGDGCDAAIRRTFRFPSLNILASDLLSYASPSPRPDRTPDEASPFPCSGNETMSEQTDELSALLERVEKATDDDQWGIVREIGKALIPNDPWRAQLNALCDAGGFTDAAIALVERVLPEAGWLCGVTADQYMAELFRKRFVSGVVPRIGYATAPTPALALLAAVLKALIAQSKAAQG